MPTAPIENQAASNGVIDFQLAANAFVDPNAGDTVEYLATLDGTALPDWPIFDAATRTFSGTMPMALAEYEVAIYAMDQSGLLSSGSYSFFRAPSCRPARKVTTRW